MTKEIIIRPMYNTDENYVKGMYVAILDGKIIARHTKVSYINIPEKYKGLPERILTYDEIDWDSAGYGETKPFPTKKQKDTIELLKKFMESADFVDFTKEYGVTGWDKIPEWVKNNVK